MTAVLEALAIVARGLGVALVDLVAMVRAERPELVSTPLPGLDAVDQARAEAVARTGSEGGA